MDYTQSIVTMTNLIKDEVLPLLDNQLGTDASPFSAKVKTKKLKSHKIVAGAKIGLSGGFGFGAEGEATPASGHMRSQKFETESRDLYVNISMSHKATQLTGDAGAMASAFTTEVQGAYETAKWNYGRALFGDGSGKIAKITGSASTVTYDGTTYYYVPVDDVAMVKEGLIIDLYTSGGTTPAKAGARIIAVDRANKRVVTDSTSSFTVANNGFITVQHSFNREFTGLGAIFDDNITSIYGVSKTSHPFLKPIKVSAGNDISDEVFWDALTQAERDKNSKVDMIMAGDEAYKAYVAYLRTKNVRVEERTHELKGGFTAIKYLHNNRIVDVVNDPFVPKTKMWGVETDACEFHQTGWGYATLNGSSAFNLVPGTSEYRALLANYGELIVKNPGGCIEISDCEVPGT